MRVIFYILGAVSIVAIIFKWRYKMINMLMTVSFVRKASVFTMMKLPVLRKKVIPGIFEK